MKGLVIIPTYNEEDNIRGIVLEALKQDPGLQVLVVDDNSPDGTGEIVASMQKEDPRIHLLRRPGKMGLGSAYIDGFRYALKMEDIDCIFEMDADFSHNPEDLQRMLQAIEGCDLVLGSRYLEGVTVVNWPLRRLFLSLGANVYTRLVTGMPINDATGGFKCFRREVLEAIPLERIRSDGYSFQIEMNYQAWKRGFAIREIPIVFTDRRVGVSKMNRKIIAEAIWMVWRLRFSRLRAGSRKADTG